VFGDICDDAVASNLCKFADIIFLGVKPQYLAPVLESLAPHITPKHTVVSIAAGWTIAQLEAALPDGASVMRVMPNTPVLVGQGACAYVMGTHASDADRQVVHRLLEDTGMALEVPESNIDAVVGVAGSAPAYMFQVRCNAQCCQGPSADTCR
jgi:pyrroline-5-carboxylate reductase